MLKVARRVQKLEQAFRPKAPPEMGRQITDKAVKRLEASDLKLLALAFTDCEQGNRGYFTEPESAAFKEYEALLEEECQRAGYKSRAVFEQISGTHLL